MYGTIVCSHYAPWLCNSKTVTEMFSIISASLSINIASISTDLTDLSPAHLSVCVCVSVGREYYVVEMCQNLGTLLPEFYRNRRSNKVASHFFVSEKLSFWLIARWRHLCYKFLQYRVNRCVRNKIMLKSTQNHANWLIHLEDMNSHT